MPKKTHIRKLSSLLVAALALALALTGCDGTTEDGATSSGAGSPGAPSAAVTPDTGVSSSGKSGAVAPVAAASALAANTVTCAGQGRVAAAPDRAQVSFGATVQRDDAEKALADASALARRIQAALTRADIDDKDIQTSQVSLYPQNDQSNRVTGYAASIQVGVTVRRIADIGKLMTAASQAGATDIGGPSFYLSEGNAAHDKALAAAYDDAESRAAVLAKAAGKKVGGVIAIAEGGTATPMFATLGGERAAADSAVPVSPGTVDAAAAVTVSFALE